MSQIFKPHGPITIDKDKPTIGFVDYGDVNGYTHIYGPGRVFRNRLSKHYNIINFGTGGNIKNNYYGIYRPFTDTLVRKNVDPDAHEKNSKAISDSLESCFKNLPEMDYLILTSDWMFKLPLANFVKKGVFPEERYNEFFDYVGNDENILKLIDETNERIVHNWNTTVSPYAYTTRYYNIFGNFVKYLYEAKKIKRKVIGFVIDPVQYKPFLDKNNIPNTFFYFAKDKRGTRNFEQMDLGQLQHIVFDEEHKTNSLVKDVETTANKNLVFAGTIFQNKGSRSDMWKLFLRNIKSPDCVYYIPLRKNGIVKRSQKSQIEKDWETLLQESEFGELYNEVINHPHFCQAMTPEELSNHRYEHRYGLVLRCVSLNDSLNFKPILYAYKGIIPLLDFMYDPEYLQIPKSIQDKIIVTNSSDIDERIEYFNKNDYERKAVLKELRDLFNIDKWINNKEEMIINELRKIDKSII